MDVLPQAPTPAAFVRRQLDERSMTQADLAFVLGVPVQAVNQIVVGRRGVSADMATALAAVFNVEPSYILGLQKVSEVAAELARARQPDPAVARKARMIANYPVREMVKRGWLDEVGDIEGQIVKFFGVEDVAEVPHVAHAARKSSYDSIPGGQLAWLFRLRQVASRLVVNNYSAQALREALPKLHALMTAPEETRHVPRLLAECGIRYALIQGLPTSKIDGACMWIGNSPVVGMSLRYDRIDNFWFVLRHELEHVLRGDGKVSFMIDQLDGDAAFDSADLPPEERAANAAASDFCVATAQMDSWVARKAPFFSEQDLIGFACRQRIHPGIVAGQLRNRLRNYKLFSRHLVKVQTCITPTAVVDGWGHTATTSV